MKKKITLSAILAVAFSLTLCAQWSNESFTFETKVRQYRVYVPSCYNPSNPAALVIALHGLGDNMTNFSGIGMHPIADTANFIFVVPQAWADPFAGTAWNSGAGYGGYYPNSTINDVGFLNALADTAMANYSIDPLRIYLMGFSMGGFMTQRMACQSNGKFAAFASIAGTIGNGLPPCNPNRAVPILHAHGTHDSTVYYTGNLYGIDPDSLVNLWVLNNECYTPPLFTELPNTANDGDTVEHYLYPNGLQNSSVEFYRVRGGGHDWMYKPVYDISYSEEIWKFFRKYTNNVYSVEETTNTLRSILVYPNPAGDHIDIHNPHFVPGQTIHYSLFTMQGAAVLQGAINQSTARLKFPDIRNGMYLLQLNSSGEHIVKRVLVVRE